MSSLKFKDDMSQGELDLLMREIEALETAYTEADLFHEMANQNSMDDNWENYDD